MTKQEKLFVCGAFCKGMVNFTKIEDFVKNVCVARVRARVCRLPIGYPSLLHADNQPATWIAGHLLSLSGPDVLFALLDEFHGYNPLQKEKSLYWRESVQVELDTGATEAQAYFLNSARIPKGSLVLEDGDWQASLSKLQPLPQRLTEKQATYIRKLGSTKGRDIVPIDLELYRQLLSLELIVDKGRRLALTKLGREVHHYLE